MLHCQWLRHIKHLNDVLCPFIETVLRVLPLLCAGPLLNQVVATCGGRLDFCDIDGIGNNLNVSKNCFLALDHSYLEASQLTLKAIDSLGCGTEELQALLNKAQASSGELDAAKLNFDQAYQAALGSKRFKQQMDEKLGRFFKLQLLPSILLFLPTKIALDFLLSDDVWLELFDTIPGVVLISLAKKINLRPFQWWDFMPLI